VKSSIVFRFVLSVYKRAYYFQPRIPTDRLNNKFSCRKMKIYSYINVHVFTCIIVNIINYNILYFIYYCVNYTKRERNNCRNKLFALVEINNSKYTYLYRGIYNIIYMILVFFKNVSLSLSLQHSFIPTGLNDHRRL